MTPWTALRVVLASVLLAAAAPARFTPARYQSGSPPPTAVRAVGGGEVFVEATVTDTGRVADVSLLRTTPPFTSDVAAAVRAWTFTPAAEEKTADDDAGGTAGMRPVTSKVLVAAVFRPPTLNTPTYGEQPKGVAPASPDVAYPTSTVMPPFPPNALFDGTVLLEGHVGSDGTLIDVKVLRSAGAFDGPAADALRKWTFRPATRQGRAVDAYVYVAMSFRQPVT